MGNLNYRRIFAFAGLFSLLLIYIFLWTSMIADPKSRTGSDFSGFYTYGRIFQTRGIAYIHDASEQKRIQEQIVGYEVNPIIYTHVPLTALLSAAVVDQDYVGSFKRWAVVLLLLNALNVYLLIKTLDANRFTKENLVILSMGAFLFFPTFSGYMNGREDVLLLLGVILWLSGLLSKKYFLAGLGLSLTTIRPQLAMMLAIPFLFRHRKVLLGFILGGSIHAGLTLALVGRDGIVKFMDSIVFIERTTWFEPHSFDMPTILGFIRRNFEIISPEPVRILVWLCYAWGIAGFCILWYRSKEIREKEIGLITIAGIFLLPYAHYHDLILLLVPLFCLVRVLKKINGVDQYYLAIGPLLVSFVAGLGFVGSGVLKFPIVYLIIFMLAYLLVASDKLLLKSAPQVST
jgi:hypothetical protein